MQKFCAHKQLNSNIGGRKNEKKQRSNTGEKQVCQGLEPYPNTTFGKEAEYLLKNGTQIFINIGDYVVILKQVSLVEADFVIAGDKVEATKYALENSSGNNALFKALDNNIIQRAL
jgi:hypothetical protein